MRTWLAVAASLCGAAASGCRSHDAAADAPASPDARHADAAALPDALDALADAGGPADVAVPIGIAVGLPGMADWDALASGEKDRVNAFQSFFLHRSVGQDLQDGAEGDGYAFARTVSGATDLGPGLNGGLFDTLNGDPAGKVVEWRSMALANQATLTLAIMHFGYNDLVGDLVPVAEADYQAAVADVEAAGVRVLHMAPPLVYADPAANVPKMQVRAWMFATFPDDVIFDFTDIESTNPADGSRCEREGTWEICDAVRSTIACPSLGQGIDDPSGQGHVCYDPYAKNFAKAFLFAIYLAGTIDPT